ncbi:MAG: GNAT family N-acetyltransferase [Alloacidobacterium sp.]
MIRPCSEEDFDELWTIINDGASAYRGTIPSDRLSEPYITRKKLRHEIEDGVVFWGVNQEGVLQAVMGIQDVLDVTLIRHAYVRTSKRRHGLGSQLLRHLKSLTKRRVLIGTWADATWAIHFYEKHGFRLIPVGEKDQLLRRYWKISTVPRQARDYSGHRDVGVVTVCIPGHQGLC